MKTRILMLCIILFSTFLYAQEEVKRKDGKTIIINNDGTWNYKQELTMSKTFTDTRDGRVYKIVTIGTQTWFAENLSFKPSSGVYRALENNQNNVAKYGYLYDWETAKNVCPNGWHLPSDAEWTLLTKYLGGEKLAGGKLKSTTGWDSPNTGATNKSGFNALPGGAAGSFGDGGYEFSGPAGDRADFWTSTPDRKDYAWNRTLFYNDSSILRFEGDTRIDGNSCRCIKD